MIPPYLYHYTSIETLIYILKNRTIRFNSLSQVDDLNEGKSEDFDSIGNYVFISCWTELREESIPFWNMYTDKMKGVRIKLPSDLFNNYEIDFNGKYGVSGSANSIIPQTSIFGRNYWIVPTHNNFLNQVEYTNEDNKLRPKLRSREGGQDVVTLRIGTYKATHWAFQSEWRYSLRIFPFRPDFYKADSTSNLVTESINSIIKGLSVPFTYFDVPLNEKKLSQMEVVLGPKSSEADKIVVESIVERFSPGIIVRESELKGSIR